MDAELPAGEREVHDPDDLAGHLAGSASAGSRLARPFSALSATPA
jgi:hypothetical protein